MSSEFHLRRQMSCTRGELMSWLPGATRGALIEIVGNRGTITIDGGSVEISFEEKMPRRVGAIALPTLDVCFRFHGLDELARENFLQYFDLYTRRGGA